MLYCIKTPRCVPPPEYHPVPARREFRHRPGAATAFGCTAQSARTRSRPDRGRVGAKSQLVDENDHLLPGLTEIIDPLHKVKGKLQRVPGGSHGVLPAAHLGIELGPHGVKGILGVQGFVQLFAPGVQQGGGADAGGQFLGQQAGGGLASSNRWR